LPIGSSRSAPPEHGHTGRIPMCPARSPAMMRSSAGPWSPGTGPRPRRAAARAPHPGMAHAAGIWRRHQPRRQELPAILSGSPPASQIPKVGIAHSTRSRLANCASLADCAPLHSSTPQGGFRGRRERLRVFTASVPRRAATSPLVLLSGEPAGTRPSGQPSPVSSTTDAAL
jgi:hypothetical protein